MGTKEYLNKFKMNYGLIIIYIITFTDLLYVSNKHGEPRSDYNFWSTLISTLITLVLIWWILGFKVWI